MLMNRKDATRTKNNLNLVLQKDKVNSQQKCNFTYISQMLSALLTLNIALKTITHYTPGTHHIFICL